MIVLGMFNMISLGDILKRITICSLPQRRRIVSARRGLKWHLQRYKQQEPTRNMTYAIRGANNARGALGATRVIPVATKGAHNACVPMVQVLPGVQAIQSRQDSVGSTPSEANRLQTTHGLRRQQFLYTACARFCRPQQKQQQKIIMQLMNNEYGSQW